MPGPYPDLVEYFDMTNLILSSCSRQRVSSDIFPAVLPTKIVNTFLSYPMLLYIHPLFN
jgi:hypothetical protein